MSIRSKLPVNSSTIWETESRSLLLLACGRLKLILDAALSVTQRDGLASDATGRNVHLEPLNPGPARLDFTQHRAAWQPSLVLEGLPTPSAGNRSRVCRESLPTLTFPLGYIAMSECVEDHV
eukprot:6195505-Pleurochrysis_carterae.AAC.1